MIDRTALRLVEPLVERNPFRTNIGRPGALPTFDEARPRLPEPILPEYPEWIALYWHAWKVLWSRLAQPGASSGLPVPLVDSGRDAVLSAWECAFLTQVGIYGRRACDFVQFLNNFYSKQHADGYICREINSHDGRDCYEPFDPNGVGPNIFAWAEWRNFRHVGDETRIQEVFWSLLALHQWYRAYRTWPDGLYWTTGVSSAMENQPRVPDGRLHHRHWTWVDANLQTALGLGRLGLMAAVLEEAEWVSALAREGTDLIAAINHKLWNPESNFYQDVSAKGVFSPVKSVGAYWGLSEKDLVPKERRTLFVQQLRDNWAFNLPHRVPTMSADSEGYNSHTGNGWRGAVWPPTNFVVLKGLRIAEQHTLAYAIAHNHLSMVAAVYRLTGRVWDHYAPETAAQGEHARADHPVWSGLSCIAMLLEDIIGLRVDWPLRRITWYRYLETNEAYGVANYPLGPEGTVRLVGDAQKVLIETDVPFALTIQDRTQSLKLAVPVGVTEVELA